MVADKHSGTGERTDDLGTEHSRPAVSRHYPSPRAGQRQRGLPRERFERHGVDGRNPRLTAAKVGRPDETPP